MKKVPKFDGEYKETVFIINQDTGKFQMGIELSDSYKGIQSFDLTLVSIDRENKRTEYVLTATEAQFKVLSALIDNTLKVFANNK